MAARTRYLAGSTRGTRNGRDDGAGHGAVRGMAEGNESHRGGRVLPDSVSVRQPGRTLTVYPAHPELGPHAAHAGVVWVDLVAPTAEEVEHVARSTGLHVPTLAELI